MKASTITPKDLAAHRLLWDERDIPYGLCLCGCGEKTSIAKATSRPAKRILGEPARCLPHHQARPTEGELVEAFWDRVEKMDPAGCWFWLGYMTRQGYGTFYPRGGLATAHRFAYELVKGAVPQGYVLDHLCRNRSCVNPEHLDPVTQKENVDRGLHGVLTTHCPKGHPYAGENLALKKDGRGRRCRTCRREQGRIQRERRRAADVAVAIESEVGK